jgi:glycosyltransferase involved in cell wall biosynthesis
MSRPIRHLGLISDAPHFGGAEQYLLSMARAARRRGMDVSLCWLPSLDADPAVFSADSMDGIELVIGQRTHRPSHLHLFSEITRYFRTHKPDGVIINASPRPGFWLAPWLTWQAGIASVWVHQMVDRVDYRTLPAKHCGGRMEGLHLWRWPQAVRHLLAGVSADGIVALNSEDRERLIRWLRAPRFKSHTIPHGLDCHRFRFDAAARTRLRAAWGINDDTQQHTVVIGTAARLSREKGIDLLLRAAAMLQDQGISLLIAIAGQGPMRTDLAQIAEALDMTECVRFIDFIEDMPAFYSALDVFVLSSRTESFGLSLAEAMACECLCVATPTAGAAIQINHGINGLLASSFEPAALADAVTSLTADEANLDSMRRHARQGVIQQYSIDLTLERTLTALGATAANQRQAGSSISRSRATQPMILEDVS